MSLLDDIQKILDGANGSCDSVYSNTNGVVRKAYQHYEKYFIQQKWYQGKLLHETLQLYEQTYVKGVDPSPEEFAQEFKEWLIKPPLWNAGINELAGMMHNACDTGIDNVGFGCNKSNRIGRCHDYVDRKITQIQQDKDNWEFFVMQGLQEAVKKDFPGIKIEAADIVAAFVSFGANAWVKELADAVGNLNLGPNVGPEQAHDLITQFFSDNQSATTTSNNNIKTMGLSMLNNPVAVIAGIVLLAILASMLFTKS